MGYVDTAAQSGAGPSHVQGGTAEVLLTPGDFFRNNPDKQQQYFRKNALRPTFLHKLKVLGFSMGTQARYIEHWEEPQVKEYFKIGTVETAAGGAGLVIILNLSADSMDSWADDMGGTQYGSRPRAMETFILPDRTEWRITAKDETVNPHRITVKPMNAALNANTYLVANAYCYIIGVIKAEATGQPKGLIPNYYKYTNNFAIVADTDLVSGTAMTIKSPFAPIPGKPNYFYVKSMADAEIRHERQKGLRSVWGRTTDNSSDMSTKFGKEFKFKGTEGLNQFATTYGFLDTFPNINSYVIEDLFAITNYYQDLQLSYGDLATMQGSTMAGKTDMLLKDFVSDTCVDYLSTTYASKALTAAQMDSPQYDGKKLFLNFGFKGFWLNGFNVLFTGMEEFNNPTPGFEALKETQFTVPIGFFTNKKNDDRTPIMGYEYHENPEIGYSRENEIWHIGGAGPASMVNKCEEFDVKESFLRSDFATHFSHGQWWYVQQRA